MSNIKDYDFHKVKTGKFYCQEVKVLKVDELSLVRYFESQIENFPRLFSKLNISLNFKEIEFKSDVDTVETLTKYHKALTKLEYVVVGVTGINAALVKSCGLTSLKSVRDEGATLLSDDVATPVNGDVLNDSHVDSKAVIPVVEKDEPAISVSNFIKVHKGNVRGGQIVVSEGDLLIIGNVGCGAEVAAAGSVTVCGRLDGRAHAGTELNEGAFVLATEFNPELISVNGVYSTSASIEEGVNKNRLRATTLVRTDENQTKLIFEGKTL